MKKIDSNALFASVEIENTKPLGEMAQLISETLNIPPMIKDVSGKYEEFPVYTCFALGLTIALIGRPTWEQKLTSYELEITSSYSSLPSDSTISNISSYVISLLRCCPEINCLTL